MFNNYLVRFNAKYNRELPKEFHFQKRSNFRQHVTAGTIKFKVERLQEFERDLDAEIDWKASIPGEMVAVNVPFMVRPSAKIIHKLSGQAMEEANLVGRAQFRFSYTNETDSNGRVIPQLKLSVDSSA